MPAEEAKVSPLSRGWMLGEGVFETMVWRGNRVEALRRHWLRLCEGAARLGLPAPDLNEMNEALTAVVQTNENSHRLRYTICRNDSDSVDVCASASPLTVWPDVEHVSIAPWKRNADSALVGIKSVAYAENVIALRHAKERACGEALLSNTQDQLCEGTGSNVFVVIGGRILTPPLASGCLAGTTRGLILESGIAHEEEIRMSRLADVTEIFLTSSTRGVQPVGSVDGRSLDVINGSLTHAASEALQSALASE